MTEKTQIPITQIEAPAEPIEVSDENFKQYVDALPQDKFNKFGPDQHDKVDPVEDWNPVKLAGARLATIAVHGLEVTAGGKQATNGAREESRRQERKQLGLHF